MNKTIHAYKIKRLLDERCSVNKILKFNIKVMLF